MAKLSIALVNFALIASLGGVCFAKEGKTSIDDGPAPKASVETVVVNWGSVAPKPDMPPASTQLPSSSGQNDSKNVNVPDTHDTPSVEDTRDTTIPETPDMPPEVDPGKPPSGETQNVDPSKLEGEAEPLDVLKPGPDRADPSYEGELRSAPAVPYSPEPEFESASSPSSDNASADDGGNAGEE